MTIYWCGFEGLSIGIGFVLIKQAVAERVCR